LVGRGERSVEVALRLGLKHNRRLAVRLQPNGLEVEGDMKRLILFGSSLALVMACTKGPEVRGNGFVASTSKPASAAAQPIATSGVGGPSDTASASAKATADKAPESAAASLREVTIPAGTVLPVDLETSVGSDISRVEQPVQGRLRHAITINGAQVLPAGTAVSGYVTAARRPGKVKGRGYIAMRFTQLDTPGAGTTKISTATVSRMAPATKEKDALEIVAPAAAGAVIGRVVCGKSGAAKGTVIGGAAGTGYVLSTRGKEVRLGKGADLAVKLTAPVTVRLR